MNEGIIPVLKASNESYGDDEEVATASAKILSGISDSLLEDPTPELIQKFKGDGGVDAIVLILSRVHTFPDEEILLTSLSCFETFEKLKIAPEGSGFAGSLVQSVKKKMKPVTAVKCFSWLLKFAAEKPEHLNLICEKGITDRIVELLSSTPVSSDEQTVLMIETGFMLLQAIARANRATAQHMEGVIKTMDTFKARKGVIDKGSVVLASMLGPTELKKCLNTLSSATSDSKERQEALILLSSMSYIGSYADAVVAAGGITLLCDAVRTSAQALQGGSKEQQLVRGLNGACKMLRKIATNPQNVDPIVKAKGVEVLAAAFKSLGAFPTSMATCCETLAELVKREDCAMELHKLSGYQAVLQSLGSDKATPEFSGAAVALVANATIHDALGQSVLELDAVGILSKRLAAAGKDDLTLKGDCITALTRLAPRMKAADAYFKSKGHQVVLDVLSSSSADHLASVTGGLQLIARLIDVPGAIPSLQQGDTVNAVMAAILTFQHAPGVVLAGTAILDRIATEDDVKRCLQDLDRSIAGARSDPNKAYRSLAGVNGLSQVAKLRVIFEKNKAAESVQKGITAWIEGPQFPSQQKLITSAAKSIASLKIGSSLPLDATITSVFNSCLLPQLRSLLDKQESKDNNLLDLTKCARTLCSHQNISSDSVPALMETVLKVALRYQEIRRVQVECLEMVNDLQAMAPPGPKLLSESGSLKTIISYMQKVVIFDDVQASGLRLLNTALKRDPTIAESIKSAGGIELCKAIRAAHGGSNEITRVLLPPVVKALMPADMLDAEMKKFIDAACAAIIANNLPALFEAMSQLTDLSSTAEGSKSAAQNRIASMLQELNELSKTKKPSDVAQVAAEASKLINNVVDTRVGLTHIARSAGVEILANLLSVLSSPDVPDSVTRKTGIEANLRALAKIMKEEKQKADKIDPQLQRRQIVTLCLVMSIYPDDKDIGGVSSVTLGAIPGDQLTTSLEFTTLVKNLVKGIQTGDPTHQAAAVHLLGGIMSAGDARVLDHVGQAGGIAALFQALDAQGENAAARRDILGALSAFSAHRNIGTYVKETQGEAGFSSALGILSRTLQVCSTVDDLESATATAKLINQMTTTKDMKVLQELGINSIAADLLQRYPNSKELTEILGELLGKSGAGDSIEALIEQIVATMTKKDPGWQRTTEILCSKLAVFVPAKVEAAKAFAKVPELCGLFGTAFALEKGDARLLASMAVVSRRLCDRFEHDASSSYGLNAIKPSVMPAIAHSIVTDEKSRSNREFLMNSYRVMAVLARHAATHASVLTTSSATKLVPTSYDLMRASANDPAVLSRILDYLAALSSTPEGANVIVGGYKKTGVLAAEDELCQETLALMRKHKKDDSVMSAAVELLGNLQMEKTSLLHNKYVTEIGSLAECTPGGTVAHINVLTKVVGKGFKTEVGQEILKVDERFNRMYESDTTTAEQKASLAIAYADFMAGLANTGAVEEIKRSNAVDTLQELLEDFSGDPDVLLHVVNALRALADADGDLNVKIARQIGGVLMTQVAGAIQGNPLLCEAVLQLLHSLASKEGNGRLLANTVGFNGLLTALAAGVQQLDPKGNKEVSVLLKNLKNLVEKDDPKSLTLQQVHQKWSGRKEEGETLELAESAVVLQQFDFVADYTEEYSQRQLDSLESEAGSEFRYGCLCFSLLHEYASNVGACVEKKEPEFMLKAIEKQPKIEFSQMAVIACKDFCAHTDGAAHLGTLPRSKEIIVAAVKKGKEERPKTPQEADALMIPRLELLERSAISRRHYNDTECMDALISIWDDCDDGLYTVATVKGVFRAMRKIVNETWLTVTIESQVPRRLIEVVNNLNADITVLPDVLFLLGALSSVPQLQVLIGEEKGVESCLDLLRRCLKNTVDNTAPVQTNACLALANITMSNPQNTGKLVAGKGIEMNVEIMEKSMKDKTDYDVANAAGVLMCNLCYRQDDIKQLFGKKGGPSTITNSIQKYDGEDSKAAFRCVASILKAIGNLALYPPNVQIFLDHGVEKTFAHLYSNSDYLPDELVEVSLRTMSNLVLEYTDDYMKMFGVVLVPLLTMLQKTRREDVKLLTLAFEVLGNLSRLPANAKEFVDHGGIDTTLKIANQHTDPRLCSTAIRVLSVQMTNPDNIVKLIDANVFTFLVTVFEGQASTEELNLDVILAGLRCARRLLANRSAAEVLVAAGGPPAAIKVMAASVNSSLPQLEVYKLLLCLISLFPAPPPVPRQAEEDEWSGQVPDEGILSVMEVMDRPPGPRSWECIGLTPIDIRKLVASIATCLNLEPHAKLIKLQRCGLGLLAYFACEKVPGTVNGFQEGQFHTVARLALTNMLGEIGITEMVCIMLINIFYISALDDYIAISKDKGLIKALQESSTKIPKKSAKVKDMVVFCQKLLQENKDLDPKKFESMTQWEFPIELTEWNKEPYPNGVQDLPTEMKSELRAGGRAKLIMTPEPKQRVPFQWKSSQDMTMLQWKTNDDPTSLFNHQLSISRIRAINRGLVSQTLRDANAADRKVNESLCLVLVGPPSEDSPSGAELNLKMKSKKERDQLASTFTEWRDAASYSFS